MTFRPGGFRGSAPLSSRFTSALETQIEQQTGIRPELEFSDALAAGDDIGGFIDDQIQSQLDALDAEIAQLEQGLAQGPQVSTGQQFELPTAPPLPGAEILENPLLKAIQDDVSQRLMANQAARGKLGSGETALALQSALAPTALNLGLTQQAREQAQRQQNVSNLFNLMGLGANVASGQGTAAMQGASNIGSAYQAAGQARAGDALARGNAISGTIGGLAQLGGFMTSPLGATAQPASQLGGGLFGTPFQSTAIPFTA